jgi:hypothetical protein
MRGIQLRARAGLRLGRGRWLVPPWIAPAFALCALVLVPWAAFLFFTLPQNYTANHWRMAWGGFDLGLGTAMVATAIAVARRSPFAEVAAAVTGTLLVCDAWFDVLTASTTGELVQAGLEALLIELPLAALCFWMATNLAHAVEVARPFLQAAGFRVEGNRLLPPEGRLDQPALEEDRETRQRERDTEERREQHGIDRERV